MSVTINAKGTSVSSFTLGKNKFTLDASGISANRTWVLPDSNGSAGQVLTTNGAGVLSWAPAISAPLVISANTTDTAVRITQTGSGNAFVVEDSEHPDSTPFVITNDGRVLIGTTSSTRPALFQLHSTTNVNFNQTSYSTTHSPGNGFARSRGTEVGENVAVINGDSLGTVNFQGANGTTFLVGAAMTARVDGEPSTTNVPTRIEFSTDNGTSSATRLIIASSGALGLGGSNYGTAGQALISAGPNSPPIWQSFIADLTGAVTLEGAQTVIGAKTFSAITSISNTTASDSVTTGALVVAGGVGVVGAIHAGSFVGNASTASSLESARTFLLSGDVTGISSEFDGSENATISATLSTVNNQPQTDSFRKITVNGKGLVTGTSEVTLTDITASLGFTPYDSSNPAGYTSNTGTVTEVTGTGEVSGLTLSGSITTTGSLTLGGTLAVAPANFGSQLPKLFLASPNVSSGVPSFRAIVASDIPTLNQNTTGTATNATNINITNDTTTVSSVFPTWVTANTDTLPVRVTSTRLSFVPSTGVLSATQFSGSGAGLTSLGASNFASQTARTFLAAGATAGVPSFRVIQAADIPTLNQNTTGTAANVTGTVAVLNGGTGATTATAARTNLGATTVGEAVFTAVDAAAARTAIGAGTSSTTGTVTQIIASTTAVSGLSLSGGTITDSGTIAISGTLAVTPANFASQTARTFLAAGATAGVPTFRTIQAADVPTLNQNTTGTAANATNIAITNDTAATGTVFPVWVTANTGNLPSKVTSTRLSFVPSTGVLSATQFSGSGAGLTNIPNSALTNSSITVGTTSIALGGSSTTLTGLTSVTSTAFSGALNGSVGSVTPNSGTFNFVTITSPTAPQLEFRENDQTLPAGRVRWTLDGNTFSLRRNTAVAGDFSTYTAPFWITSTGDATFSHTVRANGGFILPLGTELLPSLSFIDDPDTGLYSPTINTVAFSTAGVERLRIASNGNVGISTTSPRGILDTGLNVAIFGAPTDHWAGGAGYYGVGALPRAGQLDTHGGFQPTLTANGYRGAGSLWVSYGTNGYTGAAQVAVDGRGIIFFNTQSVKNTGEPAGVTTRAQLQDVALIMEGDTTIRTSNGSASLPSFTFRTDTNTGFYSDAADVLSTSTAGQRRMTVNSNGRIQIGPFVPEYHALEVRAISYVNSQAPNGVAIRGQASQGGAGWLAGMFLESDASGFNTFSLHAPNSVTAGANTSKRVLAFRNNVLTLYSNNEVERLQINENGAFGINGANFGTAGQVLTSNSSTAAPSWTTIDASTFGAVTIAGAQTITGQKTFTQPVLNANGTALLPSTSFANDPDTGIFSSAANTISISAGGTELVRTGPTDALSVYGPILMGSKVVPSGTNTAWIRKYAGGFNVTFNPTVPHLLGIGQLNINSNHQTLVGQLRVSSGGTVGVIDFIITLRSNTLPSTSYTFEKVRTTLGKLGDVQLYEDTTTGTFYVTYTSSSLQSVSWEVTVSDRANSSTWSPADGVVVQDLTGLVERPVTSATKEFSSNVVVPSGTAPSPSLSFANDPNTGLYSPSADTVAITTGGSRVAQFTGTQVSLGPGDSVQPLTNVFMTVDRLSGSPAPTMATGTVAAFLGSGAAGSSSIISLIAGNAGTSIVQFGDTDSAFSGQVIYDHSVDDMRFITAGNEAMRLTSANRVLIGSTTPRLFNGSFPRVSVSGTINTDSTLLVTRSQNDSSGGIIAIAKTRGNLTDTSVGAVQSGDTLGNLVFAGGDAASIVSGASIRSVAEGTWSTTSRPSNLEFVTIPVGGVGGGTRLIIDGTGNVSVTINTPSESTTTGALTVAGGLGVGGAIHANHVQAPKFVATSGSALLLKVAADSNGIASILRTDSENFYLLLTNNNDADGPWNNLRPFTVSKTTGAVTMAHGLSVTGAVTATSFAGNGANLTSLNASELTSGTVPNAAISGSYSGLTDITATGVVSAGSVTVGVGTQRSITLTRTATTQVALDTVAIATTRVVKYLISITRGTVYHYTEITLLHNGTDVNIVEVGTIKTGADLATFSADMTGGMRLLVTPTATTSTTFKVVATSIAV